MKERKHERHTLCFSTNEKSKNLNKRPGRLFEVYCNKTSHHGKVGANFWEASFVDIALFMNAKEKIYNYVINIISRLWSLASPIKGYSQFFSRPTKS